MVRQSRISLTTIAAGFGARGLAIAVSDFLAISKGGRGAAALDLGTGFAATFALGFAATFALGFAATFALGFAATFALGFAATFALGFAATFALGFAATFALGFAFFLGAMSGLPSNTT
jgi:hypothetical protein